MRMSGLRLLRIGTRGSALALRQAEMVKENLINVHQGLQAVLVPIKTSGDKIKGSLVNLGGKGLFVKEIEEALLAGQVDMAVHSMKDLPGEIPAGLVIAAVPLREDPRDVLISREGKPLSDLPSGARLGTSSVRRRAQLLAWRPDLVLLPLRGNLDTRLKKLKQENLEGIVVAAAGLKRMGWEQFISHYFPPEEFIPAIGQGALAIETKAGDEWTQGMVSCLNCKESFQEVAAERAFAKALQAGCQVPVAGFAQIKEATLNLVGLVISPDGKKAYSGSLSGSPAEAHNLGFQLADQLLAQGAEEVLKEFHAQ